MTSIRIVDGKVHHVYTREEWEQVQEFKRDLAAGRADIAFEGTFDETISYLRGLM